MIKFWPSKFKPYFTRDKAIVFDYWMRHDETNLKSSQKDANLYMIRHTKQLPNNGTYNLILIEPDSNIFLLSNYSLKKNLLN